MDVPLAHYDIGIRHGLKGYERKSSTFSPKADVVGLSALFTMATMWVANYFNRTGRIIFQSFLVKIERKRRIVHYLLEMAL